MIDAEKERNSRLYLEEYKGYVACMVCGTLIPPKDLGNDIAMCFNCMEYQMKD
ncbi:hypothetical protein [Ligilactobacillus acidipiscis]|uniref:hypothetical protein n=1 Tax=Ligilactobacillus acidipiscis TaxID=89059 RepID=UPI000A21D46A|nr:hypothetical protein [Ligilactobacillus acidipiscis]GAW65197.1 hypothetical protein Lacidipiscis_02440 [Ligilactobacillus acidipiscis]GEN21841.1 hypothetical protein LAC02_51220 [Ligilactobacillus acidipiscis]